MKDLMIIEARLKNTQQEVQKAATEKANMEKQITDLSQTQNQLVSKIKESQEFMDICTRFMQKNGLMVNTSFISDTGEVDQIF